MTLRPATTEDFPAMCRMGRDFHNETLCSSQSEFDDESFCETLERLIGSEDALVLALTQNGKPIGMAAALLQPLYFNKTHISCNELFCWVDPDARGEGMQLFDAIEAWGEGRGANTIIIARVPGMRGNALARLYAARGFIETDIFYTKVI